MKVLVKSFILLIFLLECRFLYIVPMPNIISKYNNYSNKIAIFVLIAVAFIILMLYKRSFYIVKQFRFNKLIGLFMYIFVSEIIISYLNYNQSIVNIAMSSYYFLIILFYYLVMYYLRETKNIDFLKKTIIIFSLLLSIIFVMQAIIYNSNGNLFLKIAEIDFDNIPVRGNTLRLTQASTIISIGIILSFSEIIKAKTKLSISNILNILNLFFSLSYLIFVCQTRVLIICELISLILMLVFRTQKNFLKKNLIVIGIVCALVVVYNLDITKSFIASFSDPVNQISETYRREEVSFYIQQVKDNIFFGRGFVDPIEGNYTFDVVHGYQGYLYTTDVGILGLLSILGIVGGAWYVAVLMKLFNMLITLIRTKETVYYIELIGILVYLISTSATLIVTDPQRIILLPIIMAFFEYYYLLYKTEYHKNHVKSMNINLRYIE